MRGIRIWLVLVVAAGFIATPVVAQAHKYKTKIVFSDLATDDFAFGDGGTVPELWVTRPWTFETTSLPVPTIKGRLLYYRKSVGRWLPLTGRSVYLTNMSIGDDRVARTDRKGYFRHKIPSPRQYGVRYYGSAHTRWTKRTIARSDIAYTQEHSTFTTASVDATNTRISVQVDYRYSRHVDDLTWIYDLIGRGVMVRSGVIIGDLGYVYENTSINYNDTDTGLGHSEWGCVLPNELLDDGDLKVESSIEYVNPWINSFEQP